MIQRNKYKLLLALLILLSVFAYIISMQHEQTDKDNSTSTSNGPKQTSEIPQNDSPSPDFGSKDILSTEIKMPTPAAWQFIAEPEFGAGVAHPPDLAAKSAAVNNGTSESAGRLIYLGTSDKYADRICTLSKLQKTLDNAAIEYEARDEPDDDVLTTPPGRIWYNITDKDTFTYDSRMAIKYNAYERLSIVQERLQHVVYMVGIDGKTTLRLACTLKNGVDESLVDLIFHQIVIDT